jgi:hypothetical protein
MLYKLGYLTLKDRDNLLKLLSIYKQLMELKNSLHIALSGPISQILRNNFSGTPENINKRTRYQDMLQYAGVHEIPFFNTAGWFKERYDNYLHAQIKLRVLKTPKPTTPPSYSYERSYPETFAMKVLLLAFALLSLLKSCA